MRRVVLPAVVALLLSPPAALAHKPPAQEVRQGPGQAASQAETNPARTCRTLRGLDRPAFERLFGTRANAFGRCASTVAKARGRGAP